MYTTKSIHEKYHRKTSKQDRIISNRNFTYRILIPKIENSLNSSIKTVLDIGCGAGTLCLYLAHKGYYVTGIDISEKAIKECKESAAVLNLSNKTKFLIGNFQTNKIAKKFDLIIFTEVIEHLENDKLALKKIHDLLNKNGLLILSTPSQNAPLYRLGLLTKFDRDVGHLRRYKLKELSELIQGQGFKIIETNKSEGVVRNFLFTNPIAGKSIRIINKVGGNFVTFIDDISLRLFGESQLFIIAKKVV